MTTELRNKLFIKCVKIYVRKKSLWPVYLYLNRLTLEGTLRGDFWDFFKLEIRKQYFPDLTVDSLLEESLALYRSNPCPSAVLYTIWDNIDWKIPLIDDEYQEFIECFEELLKKEPNPPSKEDWDDLEEHLMK